MEVLHPALGIVSHGQALQGAPSSKTENLLVSPTAQCPDVSDCGSFLGIEKLHSQVLLIRWSEEPPAHPVTEAGHGVSHPARWRTAGHGARWPRPHR